jgi:hypothetical protein
MLSTPPFRRRMAAQNKTDHLAVFVKLLYRVGFASLPITTPEETLFRWL